MPDVFDETELEFLDSTAQPSGGRAFDESDLQFLDEPTRTPVEAATEAGRGRLEGGISPEEFLNLPEAQQDLAAQGPKRLRGFLETVGTLAAVPATGGLSLLPRAAVLAGTSAAASLATEPIAPTPGGAAGKLKRAATKGATAAVAEGVGSAVSKGAQIVAPKVAQVAQNQAAKALGLIQAGFRKLGIDKARRMGAEALEKGIVTPLAGGEKMLARAVEAKGKVGDVLGQFREALDIKGAGVNAQSLARRLADAVRKDVVPGTPEAEVIDKQLREAIQTVLAYGRDNGGKIPATALEQIKGAFAKRVFKGPLISREEAIRNSDINAIWERARGVVQDAEEQLASAFLPKGDLGRFKALKDQYGALSDAENTLRQFRVPRDIGNNQLFDIPGLAGGAAITGRGGSPGQLLTTLAIIRLAKQRGNQVVASGANQAAQALQSELAPLFFRGGAQAAGIGLARDDQSLQR